VAIRDVAVRATRAPARAASTARALVLAEIPLGRLVGLALNHGMFETQVVEDAAAALKAIAEWEPHLVIVDLDVDPTSSIKLLKRGPHGMALPSIALTRRGDMKSKLAALDAGADDIITVPFSPEELVARVIALMRRTYGKGISFVPLIRIRGLEIDLLNQQVSSGSIKLKLTSMEQALLYLLASNAGQTLSREYILDTLWGSDYVVESNVVDRQVRNLRTKLRDDWKRPRFIATVAGQGYRFIAT
jgi:DNA-binding response OmpR family regulator